MTVFIASGLCLIAFLQRIMNPPPYYVDAPSINVLQSEMFYKSTTNGPRIFITGMLTNESPVAWRDIEVECRFLGTNGNLIDAYPAHNYLTVNANDDSAFRVTVTPIREAAEYASFKLFVTNARNKKGVF